MWIGRAALSRSPWHRAAGRCSSVFDAAAFQRRGDRRSSRSAPPHPGRAWGGTVPRRQEARRAGRPGDRDLLEERRELGARAEQDPGCVRAGPTQLAAGVGGGPFTVGRQVEHRERQLEQVRPEGSEPRDIVMIPGSSPRTRGGVSVDQR